MHSAHTDAIDEQDGLRMLRTAILLLSGNAFGWFFLFARNLLIARLVSVEDYGIAATFALSMAVVEMASGLGIQQLIVQDKDGESPQFQAGLQGVHLIRSVLSAVFLFALAPFIASFLGIPHLTWAYQVLAVIPALRGFEHFDMYRLNRKNIYYPILLHAGIPAIASLLVVWPLFELFGDFRVMLYSMLVQWICGVTVSHLVAKRKYSLAIERNILRKCITFGWPILINNVLLFLVLQGDKVVVAREFGIEVFAIFSMGATLTMVPVFITSKSHQMFFLPRLSSAQDDPTRFHHLSMASMQASLVSGLFLVVGVLLLGEPLVRYVLGEKYAPLVPLLIWLAIQQAARGFKQGSYMPALAKAHTKNAMVSNLVRLTVFPVVWYGAVNGKDLFWIIHVSIFGELISYFTSLYLVNRKLQMPLWEMVWPVIVTFVAMAILVWHDILPVLQYAPLWLFNLGSCVLLLIVVAAMPSLRTYVAPRTFTGKVGGN